MIPTPILTVLSIFRKNGVQTLLMGGQACVFYGAAQVSKDVDLALLAEPANIERLLRALTGARPLLAHALAGDEAKLIPALDEEMRAEQAVDRAYWQPVRRELEAMRLDEARKKWTSPQAPGESH